MSKYDMLIICGLPRAGTTFLNNVFASGLFGKEYYAQHSLLFGGLGKHPLHLCESRMISIMLRYGIPVYDTLYTIDRFWRNQGENYDKILVFKHPLITLDLPLTNTRNFKTKYIFCTRDFEPWRESFISVNGHMGIHPDATDSHYEKHWPYENWKEPFYLDDRVKLVYDMYMEKSKASSNIKYFEYGTQDQIVRSLAYLIDEFCSSLSIETDIELVAKKCVDRFWRAP